MSDQDFKDKLLLDVHKEISVINAVLARIETNVATHIKRSHMLEASVNRLEKYFWMANGATATITIIFAIAKYWLKSF